MRSSLLHLSSVESGFDFPIVEWSFDESALSREALFHLRGIEVQDIVSPDKEKAIAVVPTRPKKKGMLRSMSLDLSKLTSQTQDTIA